MENFIESLYVPYQNSAVKAVVKDKIMFSVPMGTVSVPGLVTFYPDDFSVIGGQVRISSKQIDAKLDKVITTATTGRVYAVSPSGENYMQPFSSSSVSDSLVARDSDGNILLPDRQDGDNLAISRKTGDGRYVAKKPHTTGKTEVYIQTDSGISTKEVGDTAGDVPVRNVNGNITGYSPLTDNEYTTKSYVNSSIANEAADYISNNGEPFTSLEELQEYTKTHTVTNNDYAIIVVTDNDGNTRYDRYKYNESTGVWGFEYSINNSSFTEAQWAAINSGLTSTKLATMLTEIDNLMAQSLMSVDEAVVPYGESTVTYDTTDGMILHGALAVKTNDGNYWNIPLTFSLPVVAGDGLVVDIKPDNKKMTIKIDYEKVMKMPALDDQNSELAVAVGKWTSGTSSTKVPDAIQWRDCQKNVNNNAIVQRTETGNVLLPDGFPEDVGNGIDQYGNSIDNMATPKSYVDNAVANAGSKQTVVRIKTSNMFDGSITDTKITGTLDADTLSAIQGDNVVINFVFSNNSGGDSVNVCFGRDRTKEMSTAFAYFGDVIPVNSGTSGLPFSFALRVTLADGAWTLNYAQLYKSVEVDSKVSSATKNMQKTTNMVTSIGNSPSDTKYPSEKAVADYFAKTASSVVSPTVETETIAGGTKVTITDKDGAHEFDVMNGVNGTAGKSAYASAQDGGFTGTEAQFNKGLSVMGQVDGVEDTDALGIDTTVTQNSGNLITSGAVYEYTTSTVRQTTGQSTTAVMSQKASTDLFALKSDLSTLSLGVHTDGLVYIFINGNPVGTGVEFVKSGDVVGYVDDAKNIVITGDLADGTYTLKYENQDGSITEIGTLVIGSVPSYINLLPEAKSHTDLSTVFNSVGYMNGARPSSATPFYSSASGYVTTGCFQCTFDSVFYIKGVTIDASDSNCRLGFARELNNAISPYGVSSNFTNYATLETLGEQYYKATFNSEYLQTNCSQLAYFFFGGIGSGENLIVSATPIE